MSNNFQVGQGSHDPDVAPLVDRLTFVFSDREQYRHLLACRESDAQRLLDSFQWLLDVQDLNWKFRNALIVATQRLSARSHLYPACYEFKDVEQTGQISVDGGGFADIYQGSFEGQLVCIKAIRVFERSRIEHVLTQFAKEAILWGQLSHPNILPIFGLFRSTPTSRVCLVSQWMENGNINAYLKQNPHAYRLQLTCDVASGLWYLHDIGVIHGDLKGPNILVDSTGRARLADFGVSSVSDSEIIAWTTEAPAASTGGSKRWQAPELINTGDVDDRARSNTKESDIYAFGCVCYEIFTGNIPFFGTKFDASVSHKILSGLRPECPSPSSPSWTDWGLTLGIWSLMEWCWNPDPAQRPSSIEIDRRLTATLMVDNRSLGNADVELSPSKFRRRMNTLSDRIDVVSLDRILGRVHLPDLTQDESWAVCDSHTDISLPLQQRPQRQNLSVQDQDTPCLISRLRTVLDDDELCDKLVHCSENDAQRLLDSFQHLLDAPGLDWAFKKKLVAITQQISEASGCYPACYVLQGVEVGRFPHSGGSFADIYVGLFQGKAVCVKSIRIFEQEQISYLLKQISKEALLWCQLSHPNILSMFGLFRFALKVCLVSSWMENGNVVTYLESNPDVVRILLVFDIANGIEYLHDIGVIHGNLKGTNVLVDGAHRARLADFGMAYLDLDADVMDGCRSEPDVIGSNIRWQAPEVLLSLHQRNKRATYASDMYAFGCICYEIFTGKIPHHEMKRLHEVLILVTTGKRLQRPPLSEPPWTTWGLTEDIWSIMNDCWKQSKERPDSCDVVRRLAKLKPEDTRPPAVGDDMVPSDFRRSMSGLSDMIDVHALEDVLSSSDRQPLSGEQIHACIAM